MQDMTGFLGSVGGMNVDADVYSDFYLLQCKHWDTFSATLCADFEINIF